MAVWWFGEHGQEVVTTQGLVNLGEVSGHGQAEDCICSWVPRPCASSGECQGGASHHVEVGTPEKIIDKRRHVGRRAHGGQECHLLQMMSQLLVGCRWQVEGVQQSQQGSIIVTARGYRLSNHLVKSSL